MFAVCGKCASMRSASQPNPMPRSPPAMPSRGSFKLNQQQNASAVPSESAQDSDLTRTLEDGHGHGVCDAQNADEQGDRRGAPGGGMG